MKALISAFPIRFLMGTTWPILHLLSVKTPHFSFLAREVRDNPRINCLNSQFKGNNGTYVNDPILFQKIYNKWFVRRDERLGPIAKVDVEPVGDPNETRIYKATYPPLTTIDFTDHDSFDLVKAVHTEAEQQRADLEGEILKDPPVIDWDAWAKNFEGLEVEAATGVNPKNDALESAEEAVQSGGWYKGSFEFIWLENVSSVSENGMTLVATRQCPVGVLMIEVLRAIMSLFTEYSFYPLHERTITTAFKYLPLEDLMFSRFPVFQVLAHAKGVSRHRFDLLGWTEEELVSFRNGGEYITRCQTNQDCYITPDEKDFRIMEKAANGWFLDESEKLKDFPWTRLYNDGFKDQDISTLAKNAEEKARLNPAQVSPTYFNARKPGTSNTAIRSGGVSAIHRNVISVVQSNADLWPTRTAYGIKTFEHTTDAETGETITVENKRTLQFPSLGFAYATMVYGKKFTQYLEKFVQNFYEKVGKKNLLIFTLDDPDAYMECVRVTTDENNIPKRSYQHPDFDPLRKRKSKKYRHNPFEHSMIPSDSCIPGGQRGIMQKFLIPWVLNIHNIDTVWIDFDVYFFQDPTAMILHHQALNDFEILISGSFATHCICNGIVYFRATEVVRLWLLDVIHWMFTHPYEHDQKCFAGWLDWTEKIVPYGSAWALPRSGPIPRWDTLDPIRQFVTAKVVEGNGWMAKDPSHVVLFHFLAGDSDKGSDFDISGRFLEESAYYKAYNKPPNKSGLEINHFKLNLLYKIYILNKTHKINYLVPIYLTSCFI